MYPEDKKMAKERFKHAFLDIETAYWENNFPK